MYSQSLKKYISGILFFIIPFLCSGQVVKHDRIFSFEDGVVPACISGTGSELNLSSRHYKDGSYSLQWRFQPGGELILSKDLNFEKKDPTGEDTYLSTFVVWIYNNTPMEGSLQFKFMKDGKECTSFPFLLNFRGWRALWASYERDMEGIPEEGMNQLRIIAPEDMSGELFIDQLITASKADHRHHTPDVQAPFVNKNTQSHWLVLLKYSKVMPDLSLDNSLTQTHIQDIRTLEKRFNDLIYTPAEFTAKELERITEEFNGYDIRYEDGYVTGLPLFFTRAAEAFERLSPDWKGVYERNGMELRKYFTLMNRIAVAYNNARLREDKENLKEMFLAMYDHVCDQGVAYGSGLGNLTHYGYSFRGIYTAYFLMKDVLKETGRLADAEKTLRWYAMTNEIFIKPEKNGMDMDAFNTTTTGRISSILIMEDSPEKVRYLKAFSRWINNGCLPSTGLDGSFKTDGGAFHHCNNYPAYAVGGLSGATDMIYLLNQTSFAISEEAHQTVKNVLLTMRFYCNKTHFPLAMSGRHPDGKGELVPVQYARMAMSGTPDGNERIDKEMGSVFLRLIADPGNTEKPEYMPVSPNKTGQKLKVVLQSEGILPEKHPEGNLALGYGCVSVQRRNNWSAVVRGHSRYLWAAEHYLGANLYGRYLAHGSMQVFTGREEQTVTPQSSGWVQPGFDWGRIPGTTAIHLPVEQLKADIRNVDVHSGFEEMLYSDEAFAGGLSQNRMNGVFGMKLHEHDKYNGTHRARKSYHFFDGRIICLGSDIENRNDEYPTETTIFQLAIPTAEAKQYWDTYAGNTGYWLDHLGTGYYIPGKESDKLNFEKNYSQQSRMQNTGEETEGDWVVLTVDHGKSPAGESYEYVVVPQATKDYMDRLSEKMSYKVIQKDRNAHIVKDLENNITSYVLFETPYTLPAGLIRKVDTTCLVMLQENTKNSAWLTVCNPDLALYRGPSDELFDENGKRTERSIYSRPWKFNESQEIPVTITLKGRWKIKESESCRILYSDKKETVLSFICKDARSINVELFK